MSASTRPQDDDTPYRSAKLARGYVAVIMADGSTYQYALSEADALDAAMRRHRSWWPWRPRVWRGIGVLGEMRLLVLRDVESVVVWTPRALAAWHREQDVQRAYEKARRLWSDDG